ncbi:MAG: UDP-3-O-acyl-N-acetylglucosamine deacetylase [Bacteriovoracaceae bacterium]|nr:UDP-3-O-acyl-N-acetylglucosamine deacetylase [Bacteriovoracaceae bacterium]
MANLFYQRTLAKKIQVTGIGLHTGRKVQLTLSPAPADFGIQFRRIDLHGPLMKAHAELVGATDNNTSLGSGAGVIHTVEHLLAVIYGLGINNVLVEVDGPEIPIMDGSGASFLFLLKEAGVANLNASKKFMLILEPVEVELNGCKAKIEPCSHLTIDATIVFAHALIKAQHRYFEFSCENFIREIGRARTFGLLRDVDMLKRKGLIKGGSLNNAVVLDDFRVVNEEGLRFADEFVRHKILDTIGDISLLGYEVAGKITTFRSGHKVHNMLCRKLLQTPSAYKIVTASSLQKEAAQAFELPNSISLAFN